MMRKIFLAMLFLYATGVFAQEVAVSEEENEKFTFGVDLFQDIWFDLPENMEAKTILPGVNVMGTYNFPLGNSNFTFSTGLNLGVHNFKNNTLPVISEDSIYFNPIEGDTTYKRSKLNLTYLDIPLEIRFKAKKGFKFAVGFRYGFLLNNTWKYKGDDYLNDLEDEVIYKFGKLKHFENNRYGFIARVGYKKFSVFGYYPLSNLFVPGNGPEMYHISAGISYIPF